MPPKRKASTKAADAATNSTSAPSNDPASSGPQPRRSTRSKAKAKADVQKVDSASEDDDVKKPPSKRAKTTKTVKQDADDEEVKDQPKMVRIDPLLCVP
jgi:hypothetical protein